MTVTNFTATVNNTTVYLSWDATLDFSFVSIDGLTEPVLAAGVTSWSGNWTDGAIYQAVDSATTSPIPPPTEPVPIRRITLFWDEQATAVKYEVLIDGLASFVTAGSPSYSFKSQRLESGERSFSVAAIDAAGNKSPISTLTYVIQDVPNPVQSLILTNGTTPGDITATLVAPIDF